MCWLCELMDKLQGPWFDVTVDEDIVTISTDTRKALALVSALASLVAREGLTEQEAEPLRRLGFDITTTMRDTMIESLTPEEVAEAEGGFSEKAEHYMQQGRPADALQAEAEDFLRRRGE